MPTSKKTKALKQTAPKIEKNWDIYSRKLAWTVGFIVIGLVIALSLYLGQNNKKAKVVQAVQNQETADKQIETKKKIILKTEVIPNVDTTSVVPGSIIGYYRIPVVPARIHVNVIDVSDLIKGLEPAEAKVVLKRLGIQYIAFSINGLAQMNDYPLWAFQNRAVKYFSLVTREEMHRVDGEVWVIRVIYRVD